MVCLNEPTDKGAIQLIREGLRDSVTKHMGEKRPKSAKKLSRIIWMDPTIKMTEQKYG